MRLLKAQHYHITLCLEWETLRSFYSLIVNEQLMLLDNVNINVSQTLNLLFLGNYDHWVCPLSGSGFMIQDHGRGSRCIKGTIVSFCTWDSLVSLMHK